MKIVTKIIKWVLCFLLIPIFYIAVALGLCVITVERQSGGNAASQSIYLSTNGVHLDIVIPIEKLDSLLLSDINYHSADKYMSFGWGDEDFYLNTPNWEDLTVKNAFKALFLNSTTLMHVTRHRWRQPEWVEIKVNEEALSSLKGYLIGAFEMDAEGMKIILEGKGYSPIDDFYKAKGSYSCLNTCNSWVNTGFKRSGLKACLWTPFDFGLLNKYQ